MLFCKQEVAEASMMEVDRMEVRRMEVERMEGTTRRDGGKEKLL